MKRLTTKYKALAGLLLFYIPFHIFLSPTYWDDAQFARILGDYQNDLIRYTMTRYAVWSSRITIELALPFLTSWPSFVWKGLNLLILALLYCDLIWMLEHIFRLEGKEIYILTAVLLCAFPFSIMAQTGWIATTTNYLWVIALGLYAINRMLKAGLMELPLTMAEIFGAALAVIYSASFESMAAILFLVELGLLFSCMKNKKKCPAVVWVCLALTMLFLAYILACPGNRLRPVRDAEYWMPEFFRLSFLDRLRMGILSSYMHFVSLPSPVFFILNVLVFFSWRREALGKRIMAFFPVLTDVLWTGYFLLNYILGWRAFTYQVPEPLPAEWTQVVEQGLLLLTVLVWFAVVPYTLFKKTEARWAAVAVLILACLPEIAVGLTPTVIASILRTMIYLYMAMILLVVVMMEKGAALSVPCKRFCYFCLAVGVFLNACQITRHILLYG